MKFIFLLTIIFSLVSFNFSLAQRSDMLIKQDKRYHAEVMLVPALVYNSISFGLSKPISKNTEQSLNFSSFILLAEIGIISCVLRYNYNLILNNKKKVTSYIPLWLSSRYMFFSESGEQEVGPTEHMYYSIGSGYGIKFELENKHKLRIEAGAGVALYTRREYKSKNSFQTNPNYPFVASLRFNIRYLIPLGKG